MDIIDYGFRRVGEWRLRSDVNSGVGFVVGDLAEHRVLYAFVVAGDVKYIGTCEKRGTTLRDRLQRYQNRAGAGTNARIAELIRQCLERDETVEVMALKPHPSPMYKGLEVDLVKGLETPLLTRLSPEWNLLW